MFTRTLSDDIRVRTKSGNSIYWMIAQEDGAQGFELRYIEIPVGGKSSAGSHPHEHEVFVVAGSGRLAGISLEGVPFDQPLSPGMAVFVPGGEQHQWINEGQAPFGFVCVVPRGAEAESKSWIRRPV